MNYLSVCSGIEAASMAWSPLGWKPIAFSEIEKFPSAVLAHHYPDVPNLGDMTKYKEWPDMEVDVLVGGTPCQSFSVAGLRKGMADPRGNLALAFFAIAARYRPAWIVWENVPGVFSADGQEALTSIMDAAEEIGYVGDLDVLDARYFGLAQRRRRVFGVWQRADRIAQMTTPSSVLTILQCLTESLANVLDVARKQSLTGFARSGFDVSDPLLSLQKRMRLFGRLEDAAVPTLRDSLVEILLSSGLAPSVWDFLRGLSGHRAPTVTEATASEELGTESASWNTASSLRSILDESLATMSECITSTDASTTTESRIFTCSLLTLTIAAHIARTPNSCPSWWTAASSSLTALRGYIAYARQASSNLFSGVEWVRNWGDFFREAGKHEVALRDSGERPGFSPVLPFAESLCGDPPPRRETGKDVAACVRGGTESGSNEPGNKIPAGHELAPSLTASGRGVERTGESRGQDPVVVTHTLKGEGFDASEDGTGRGTPLVPDVPTGCSVCMADAIEAGVCNPGPPCEGCRPPFTPEVSDTLRGHTRPGSNSVGTIVPDVSMALNAKGGAGRQDAESETLIPGGRRRRRHHPADLGTSTRRYDPHVAGTLKANSGGGGLGSDPSETFIPEERFECPYHGYDIGEDCCDDVRPIAFHNRQDPDVSGEVTHPLGAKDNGMAVALHENQRGEVSTNETAGALKTGGGKPGQGYPAVHESMGVRRLTPLECARLQGFPDDYLDIIYRKKPAKDGPKYKALGNSMAVPVMAHIGRRIQMVEDIIEEAE